MPEAACGPCPVTRGRSTTEVLSFLLFVVGVLVVAGLLFLAGSALLGRGETQPPAELNRSPVELPDDRPVTGDDVRALRISPALRGYRMSEVDWLLDQFAQSLDQRDEEIARLQARPATGRPTPHRHPAPGAATQDEHRVPEEEPVAEEQPAAEHHPAADQRPPAGDVGNGARADA
jgi:DivIVA domain-containing protein